MTNSNSVDDFLQEGINQQEVFAKLVEKEAIKIHKVFVQTEEGQTLLANWTESLIMVPTVTPSSTQFEAGINEGVKQFVRNIIIQCQKIDADLKRGDK